MVSYQLYNWYGDPGAGATVVEKENQEIQQARVRSLLLLRANIEKIQFSNVS